MKVEIKIPKMGESITAATIGAILKQTGDQVKEGDEVVEIETEKVNQVLNAPASGKLEWNVKEGDTVQIDQVIGLVDTAGAVVQPESKKEEKISKEPPTIVQKKAPLENARKTVDEYIEEATNVQSKAPNLAPKVSKELPAPQPRVSERETRKKMSKLRKVISQRLVQVKNETAMLTTFNEVDMHAVINMRNEHQESFQKKHGVKLGFMSFFVKATITALQQFPDINARIDRDEIVYHHYYDIGIAVSTEKGLFVPVIQNADLLTFAEIEKTLKNYAEKAKAGTITVDEMQGGTFTITNGGTFGSMLSTPILNPPQSGILGMHNIVKRAVVINDEIVIRPIMYLALSYDHRIVDGKEAISFLMQIKKTLEDPARFLLDL